MAKRYWRFNRLVSRALIENGNDEYPIGRFTRPGFRIYTAEFINSEGLPQVTRSKSFDRDGDQPRIFDGDINTSENNSFNPPTGYQVSFGYDFTTPVDVSAVKLRVGAENLIPYFIFEKFVVESSSNGRDWEVEGECLLENSQIVDPDTIVYQISPINYDVDGHRYWRIYEVKFEDQDEFTHNFGINHLEFINEESILYRDSDRFFAEGFYESDSFNNRPSNLNSRFYTSGVRPNEYSDLSEWHVGLDVVYPVNVVNLKIVMDLRRYPVIQSARIQYSDDKINWFDSDVVGFYPFYLNPLDYELIESKRDFNVTDRFRTVTEFYSKSNNRVDPISRNVVEDLTDNVVTGKFYSWINDGSVPISIFRLGNVPQGLGGSASVSGITKINNRVYPNCEVRIYHKLSGKFLLKTYSDALGRYTFNNLIEGMQYFVHSSDPNKEYNAVTQDYIRAKDDTD